MRLSEITGKSRYFYRGETSTATAEQVTSAIKAGTYHGRYYVYGRPNDALAYNGASPRFVIECDIRHEDLVAENHPIIRPLLDWQSTAFRDDFGWSSEPTTNEIRRTISNSGIPAKFAEQYRIFFQQRLDCTPETEVDGNLLEEYDDIIWHCDGPSTIKCVQFCQALSQFLKHEWDQMALLLRDLDPSEFIRVITE